MGVDVLIGKLMESNLHYRQGDNSPIFSFTPLKLLQKKMQSESFPKTSDSDVMNIMNLSLFSSSLFTFNNVNKVYKLHSPTVF